MNKRRPSHPPRQIRDLNDEENETLEQNKGYIISMIEDLGVEPKDDEDTPEICDHLVRWWHKQPAKKRPPADDLAIGLGCVVGDFLMHHFDFEWKMLTDQDGTGAVLYGRPARGGEIIFAPIESIVKHLSTSPDGCVCDLLREVWERFEPIEKDEE
ncbi:MAG: DUF3806 domain-containing protein [Planctomycetes bacterium]|nr:DUF3806 domain-containing protein [Planctomycetota bacterium]